MLFNPDFTWQFKTEPSEGSGGRQIPTTQGRTLGGSSSINGMIYNRGQRADLDNWAQRGNRGWGYVDMLPYYKRTERRIGIADDRIHGREGNLPVTDYRLDPSDLRGVHFGCGRRGDTALHGLQQRRSAGRRGLFPACDPSRLAAFRRACVPASGEGDRPAGDTHRCARRRGAVRRQTRDRRAVRERSRSQRRSARCMRGARSSCRCGTANTAKLLQISGVGPAALLGSIGVPVVHELPGVGENFRDHYSARLVARVKNSAHDQRDGARHGTGRADHALGDGAAQHPGAESVAGALVLEVRRQHGPAGSAGRVQSGELQAGVRRPAGRLSRNDLRRVAAPAGEHRLCAGAVGRSVRGSDHPAELSGRPDGPPRADQAA